MDVISTLLYKIDMYDLVSRYTDLHIWNGTYRGKCPIHNGDNPTSFCLFEDKKYYCHSCGSSGNAIQFYAEMEGLPFYQAVEKLCDEFEVDTSDESYTKQKSLVKDNTVKADYFHKRADEIKDYLINKRKINQEMIDEFLLGYDKGGFLGEEVAGITIPIQDIYGRIVGFSKRRLDNGTPKYRNTKGNEIFTKGKLLYNLHRALKRIKKTNTLHITEGYLDVISAHQQGLACVGYLGGSLTQDQILMLREIQRLYKNITFILAADNPLVDDTGRRMLLKMRESITKHAPELNIRCVDYYKYK